MAIIPVKSFEDVRFKPPLSYTICQCPRVKCKFVFFVRNAVEKEPDYFTFPSLHSDPEFLSDAVTWTVREDVAEAYRCFHSHSFRAAVMMCRRAVQQMVEEKEALGEHLFDKVDHLFKRGLITESLKNAFKTLKYFKTFGAHPLSDNLEYPTQGETEDILSIVFQLLEDLYVRPAQANRILTRKEESKL